MSHLSGRQHHITNSCRIRSTTFPLLFYTEFPEASDEDALPIGQGTFEDFREGFNHGSGFP
jgi:hypothetical protein